ncbi:MAG: FAD-dependent oxidoreductase [Chthoniobacteraceae bacterium]
MDHASLPETKVDIVIVGGGVSGSMAAIAAARSGASTLLIEEHGFLGGSLTAMGVGPMMSFHNAAGEQVVKGLPDELIRRLQKRGASPGHIPDTTTYCHTVTPFDSEELKIELETMLEEAGGTVLFHTQLASVECSKKRISRLQVCNKSGLTGIVGRVFIDATGDGDLAALAGAAFEHGRPSDHATQPMTMNLKLGNVDTQAIRQYAMKHPKNFLWEHGFEEGLNRLQTAPQISLAGYLAEWNSARNQGDIHIPRDQVLFFETATPGVVIVNTSRILSLDPTNPYDLSRAETIGRRQCAELFRFLRKYCIGFAHAIRMDTSAKVGVRESRHICGLYTLTADDLETGRHFEDVIACGGYPIDIHSPDGEKTESTHVAKKLSYEIPMRCLMVPHVENLIVVGRCISATHEASAAIRVTPIAMAIGHAGGILAAEALCHEDHPQKTPYPVIAQTLRNQGAVL